MAVVIASCCRCFIKAMSGIVSDRCLGEAGECFAGPVDIVLLVSV